MDITCPIERVIELVKQIDPQDKKACVGDGVVTVTIDDEDVSYSSATVYGAYIVSHRTGETSANEHSVKIVVAWEEPFGKRDKFTIIPDARMLTFKGKLICGQIDVDGSKIKKVDEVMCVPLTLLCLLDKKMHDFKQKYGHVVDMTELMSLWDVMRRYTEY